MASIPRRARRTVNYRCPCGRCHRGRSGNRPDLAGQAEVETGSSCVWESALRSSYGPPPVSLRPRAGPRASCRRSPRRRNKRALIWSPSGVEVALGHPPDLQGAALRSDPPRRPCGWGSKSPTAAFGGDHPSEEFDRSQPEKDCNDCSGLFTNSICRGRHSGDVEYTLKAVAPRRIRTYPAEPLIGELPVGRARLSKVVSHRRVFDR